MWLRDKEVDLSKLKIGALKTNERKSLLEVLKPFSEVTSDVINHKVTTKTLYFM